jgi:hypothetical protein
MVLNGSYAVNDSKRSIWRGSNFLLADGAKSLLEEPIFEAFLVMEMFACN